MTPSSGLVPYQVAIEFLNKDRIDGVRYRFEARHQQRGGECNVIPLSSAVNTTFTSNLFNTGVANMGANVPAGQCRTFDARIVEVSSGDIFDIKGATMNNL